MINMKGKVQFNSLDPLVGRFELGRNKNFVGNRRFDVPADLFPKDFDPGSYDVTGVYSITIEIKKKK